MRPTRATMLATMTAAAIFALLETTSSEGEDTLFPASYCSTKGAMLACLDCPAGTPVPGQNTAGCEDPDIPATHKRGSCKPSSQQTKNCYQDAHDCGDYDDCVTSVKVGDCMTLTICR